MGGENRNGNGAGLSEWEGWERGGVEWEGTEQAGWESGRLEEEKDIVGRGCAGVRVVLREMGRGCQSGLGPTILGTAKIEDSSRSYGGCPIPTWTWKSSRKPISQTDSTPAGRPDTASSLRTH